MTDTDPRTALQDAIESDDLEAAKMALDSMDDRATRLNKPMFYWNQPPLARARSIPMARLLMAHGATLESVSAWWKQGFAVYHQMISEVGEFLIDEGASASPHAIAALGLTEKLRTMIDADPSVVHAKGGDGGHPLHFAGNLATSQLLVESGADLDARDDDHASTPLQWLIGDRPEIARYLIEHRATPDIFAAAALGDRALVERLIDEDPRCLSYRIGRQPEFPGIGYESLGGTIYQWTLGFNAYAHQFASKKGHDDLCAYMLERSDTRTRFLVACVMAKRELAESILAEHPDMVSSLPREDLELVARYCWETNASLEAVRLMLDLGFPIDVPEKSHSYMPLHNAAWGGYADLVDLLIERGAPVDAMDPDYKSTPLGHAIHCATEDGRHPEGEYERVVNALIDAGSPWDPGIYPTGDERVDRALGPRMRTRIDGAASLGDMELVAQFVEAGVDEDELDLALLAASKTDHVELCEWLLDHGARVRSTGPHGITAVHRAVSGGALDTLAFLIERGASVRLTNQYGSTPMHTAGMVGADNRIIALLVDQGAVEDLRTVNQFGKTPLDTAREWGHKETAALFESMGGVTGESLR